MKIKNTASDTDITDFLEACIANSGGKERKFWLELSQRQIETFSNVYAKERLEKTIREYKQP